MLHRTLLLGIISASSALWTASVSASIYTVGADAACSHSDIDAALESARTNPGPDTVRITRSQDYYDVDASATADEDLDIYGGYPSCASATPDATRTIVRGGTLGGGTGDEEPVFRIHVGDAVHVRMRGLSITGGDEDGDGNGGGLAISGGGRVEISDSAIYNNIAGDGGGIAVDNDGVFTMELVIGADVTISGNTARYSGGGIYMGPFTLLTMTAPGSVIALNKATGVDNGNGMQDGYGGGIRLYGHAEAYIGSNGQGALGAIYGNEARYGGGVATKNKQYEQPNTLYLFTTDPDHPGAIRSNFASVAGGGIYAEPYKDYLDPANRAYVRIFDANVEDNAAPQGAAIHLTSDTDALGTTTGADLFINSGSRPAGAVACNPGIACSRVGANDNVDAGNTPTDGAAIYVGDDASAQIRRALLQSNTGHEVIRGNSAGDGIGIVIEDTLIAGNASASDLIHTDGDSPFAMRRSTITDNSIGGYVFSLSDAITLETSIVYQEGSQVMASGGGTRDIEDVLANEIASIGTGARLTAANPRFADPSRGDYHLRAASPAIDYAPTQGGPDLEGNSRGVDLALVANRYGASDLGAYERSSIGNLFYNPHFAGDFHMWTLVTPGSVTYSTDNISGNGTGSAYVAFTGFIGTDVYALTQCVHLPGPGSYGLAGYGLAPGFTKFDRDALYLSWDLRYAGSESCDAGAPDVTGEAFVAGTGAWTLSASTFIDITPAQWTPTSSVSVRLMVRDKGATAPEVQGRFDGIALIPGGDLLFADDFEG